MWALWFQAHQQIPLRKKNRRRGQKLIQRLSVSLSYVKPFESPYPLSKSAGPGGAVGFICFSSIPHVGSRNVLLSQTFSLPVPSLPLSVTIFLYYSLPVCGIYSEKLPPAKSPNGSRRKVPSILTSSRCCWGKGCFYYPFSHSRNETPGLWGCVNGCERSPHYI